MPDAADIHILYPNLTLGKQHVDSRTSKSFFTAGGLSAACGGATPASWLTPPKRCFPSPQSPSCLPSDADVNITRAELTPADQLAGATAGEITSIMMLLTNVAVTKVRGLDLKMVGRVNLGEYGTLHPQLNLSHTQSYQFAPTADEKMVQFAGTTWRPTVQGNLGLAWKKAAYNLSADVIIIGKMSSFLDRTEPCTLATEGYPDLCKGIASFTVFNLDGSYSGFKNTRLSFAVQNAFDRKPPFHPNNRENFLNGLHSSMGRYFQLTADYSFK